MAHGIETTQINNDVDSTGVQEELRCPICFHLPKKEVYQCQNGHTLCDQCFRKVTDCPQCRISLRVNGAPIRNRVAETLLESVNEPCPFAGCKDIVKRKDLSDHKKSCKFNGKCINLCTLLFGLTCNFLTNVLNPQSTIDHFVDNHRALHVTGNSVNIKFDKILYNISAFCKRNCTQPATSKSHRHKNGLWKPVMVTLNSGIQLMILVFLNGNDDSLAVSVFLLGDVDNREKFPVQLSIDSKRRKTGPLKWNVWAEPVLQSKDFVKCPPVRIPFQILRKNYISADRMIIRCVFAQLFDVLHTNLNKAGETVVLARIHQRKTGNTLCQKLEQKCKVRVRA